MSKSTKATEVVGRHEFDYEQDGIQPMDRVESVHFNDMVPEECRGKRGRWRITVEFEPEEDR